MAIRSEPPPGAESREECAIRIAATGDIHLGREGDAERWAAAFAGLRDRVDLVLLAGDLTTHGEPEQAAMVAAAVRGLDVPILAVLGNHDWHVNRRDELVAALAGGRDRRARARAPRARAVRRPRSASRASRASAAASTGRTSRTSASR